MYKLWYAWVVVGIGVVMLALAEPRANDMNSGEWTMQRSDTPDSVRFSLHGQHNGHFSHTGSDWLKSEFSGLDFSRSGMQEVRFAVIRDAGRFNFEGVLRDGAGAGTYQFVPDAGYAQEMKALGFDAVERNQMAFAIHDVSVSFARDMKSAGLQDLDTNKLLAFRIHGVTRKFIEEMNAVGLSERDSGTLIAFRIHGVTPDMVQRVRAAGHSPAGEDLIAMRIHGATPEWMDEMKRHGYEQVPLAQLVAFRIHNVSPKFIGELQKLGYQHPQPEQLVSLRIHGVTPEYIGQMQARGLKDLTLEKLVSLKLHGLD